LKSALTTPEISVIICAHNPRMDYLERVLEGLRSQTLPKERWELLVIDNQSDPKLESGTRLGWHPSAGIKREEELGLTPARLRGIQEARGELLVFCDDDCVLRPDYLETAQRISREHPRLGAWGGTVSPDFETHPPDWTREHWPRLAIREVMKEIWSNTRGYPDTTPCGAGMCARKVVAQEYGRQVRHDPVRLNLDRKGTSLVSGGDDDLAWTAHDLGLGTGLFPGLALKHLIPSSRLEEEYLLRLVEAQSYSGVIVAEFHGGSVVVLPGPTRRQLGRLKRRVFMRTRPRRFLEARLAGQERALRDLRKTEGKA
jgi:hypothetical protein